MKKKKMVVKERKEDGSGSGGIDDVKVRKREGKREKGKK